MKKKSCEQQFDNSIQLPLNSVGRAAKTVLAGYYKFYGASLLNYNQGTGTSIITLKTMNKEENDKDYVEFKETVIRYAVDKKLYSGEEHDYVPTRQMLADDSVKDISRLRMLYKALCERYGEDKATSCPVFRIRKLTPREVFRLMDVDDADIDKIFAYRYPDNEYEEDCQGDEVINVETGKRQKHRGGQPISNSKLYQLAGNSIVVNCLYYIFKNLFVNPSFSETSTNGYKVDGNGQLSLF